MNLLRLLSIAFIFTFIASSVSAWGYVADTWNTNQVYAGSFYKPSSAYSGWTYNVYYPSNGYDVMGGGNYYPPGYPGGYYYGGYAYGSPSYPGHYVSGYVSVPIHSTYDYGYYGPSYHPYHCPTYFC